MLDFFAKQNSFLSSLKPWAVVLVGCVVLSEFVYPGINPYYQTNFMLCLLSIMLGVSLTLINGFTGQFSLGHAGFMAVGAYTSAGLTVFFMAEAKVIMGDVLGEQIFFLVALVAGASMSAIFGYLVGLPSLRLKGDYLAIVTLGFGEIIRVVLLNINVLGGARGLTGIPAIATQRWMIYCTLLVVFSVMRLLKTPMGRSMFSVREDEVAAEAMGVNTTSVKVKAFVMGAFWAGLVGGLYAHFFAYLNPANFNFMKSFEPVVIIVLGGLGSVGGAIIAAIILTLLPEALRPIKDITGIDFRMIIYSLLLIFLMLGRPDGLLGRHELNSVLKRFWQKIKQAKESAA